MTQTAIVITLADGSQVLVRVYGEHIHADRIAVDTRDDSRGRWLPIRDHEVRHES